LQALPAGAAERYYGITKRNASAVVRRLTGVFLSQIMDALHQGEDIIKFDAG